MATFHGVLLEELARSPQHGIEVAGVFVLPPDELDPDRTSECPAPLLGRIPRHPNRRHPRMLRRAKPDVILFNHVTNRKVARWAKLHHELAPAVPAIGIVHSWHPVTQFDRDREQRRLEFAQRGIEAVQALCFGSSHCRAEGEELGVTYPPLVEVIHYPLQHAYLAPADVVGVQRRGVAYLGSLMPRKNVSALIEAIATRPGLELTVAGEGVDEAELRALASRLGTTDRTRFINHYPVDDHLERMRQLLLGSAVLCLPSTSESFGLVMIEALACGTPVVGFAPTLAEIEDRMGISCGEGLATVGPASIAAAIDRVLARDWDRAELRRRCIQAFAPGPVAGRYARLISTLAGR